MPCATGLSRSPYDEYLSMFILRHMGLPWWLSGKESAFNAGDSSLIPGLGRSLGGGNRHPPQYSCLGNPMDRGAWWATAMGSQKESDTTTKQQQTHASFASWNSPGWLCCNSYKSLLC